MRILKRSGAGPGSAPEPSLHFRRHLNRFGAEERFQIARIKRILERYVGDPRFRDAIQSGESEAVPAIEALELGAGFDIAQTRPIWDPDARRAFDADPSAWPAYHLWKQWLAGLIEHRDLLRDWGSIGAVNPRFQAWREREMARCRSELPEGTAHAIVHPIAAWELSSGCTMGCWFCGISAEAFKGAWPYDRNGPLWRSVLGTMVDRFGTAAQTGFCYWATDPMDNPDYDRFVADHRAVTGFLPQTTTAAPLKDIALTRRVLALAAEAQDVVSRFSILSVRELQRVHAAFTPDELLTVELVIQAKDSLVGKSAAGRMRDRKLRDQARGGEKALAVREIPEGTIACVSGFLVNMPEGRLQLIAPCRPSDRNPLGYRTYAEGRFTDAAGFASLVDDAIARCMSPTPDPKRPLMIREDLDYEPVDDRGFLLRNNIRTHRVTGGPYMATLGRLLQQGLRAGEVIATAGVGAADPFTVASAVQDLFDGGLIEHPYETIDLRGVEPMPAEQGQAVG